MFGWFRQVSEAIDRIYERRLRRASGLDMPAHRHVTQETPPEDEGDVEIANVVPGTLVEAASSAMAAPLDAWVGDAIAPPAVSAALQQDAEPGRATIVEDQDEVEGAIVNLTPGSERQNKTSAPGVEDADGEAEIVNVPPGSTA